MMRISTSMLFQQGLNGITDQQARTARTFEQLSTGRQVNRVSDDPVAAARIQELERAVAQQTSFIGNNDRVQQRLGIEESALDTAGTVLRRVRELAVQASNDTNGVEGRRLIAVELRQRLEELQDIGNSRSGEGEFIFAGAQSQTRPFTLDGGEISYEGDSVQRELLISPGTTIPDGDTGDDVFMRIRNGNGVVAAAPDQNNAGTGVISAEAGTSSSTFTIEFTGPQIYDITDPANPGAPNNVTYEPGATISYDSVNVVISGEPDTGDSFAVEPASFESAFTTIDQLADALELSPGSDAARAGQRQAINDALGQLDRAENRLLEVRADVGARLNTLQDVQNTQDDVRFSLEKLASDVRDIDFAEVVSRLQQEQFTLQAAQQSFVRIQGNSLFNFL